MLAQIRDDPEDLADEIVQSLRVGPDAGGRFAGPTIAAFDVQDPPVGIARTGSGIEDHIAHRVSAGIELHPHQFPGSAFEGRIRNIRVGPLHQDSLVLRRSRS